MDDKQHSSATDDPLIECLLIIGKHYGITISKEEILNALPPAARSGKFSYPKLIKAASYLNLSGKLVKATLAKLYILRLPVILILENEEVCVLNQIEKKNAYIVIPSNPTKVNKISIDRLKQLYSGFCYTLLPSFNVTDEKPIKTKYKTKWFWQVIFKQLPTYSEVFLASFLINIFTLASPLFIMNVYDKVIPHQAFATLWTLGIAVGIVLIFDFTLRELRTYFLDVSSKNVDSWFSATLFEQLLEIKMAARPASIGTLINAMQSFENIKEFISSTTILSTVDFPFTIIFLVVIYFLGGWLVLIPLITIPITLLVSYIGQERLTDNISKTVHYNSQKQAILVETLQNIPGVKSSLSEGTMQRRFEMITDKLAGLSVKNRSFTNLCVNLSIFFQYFTSVAIVVGGVYLVTAGEMRLGALIAVTILAGRAIAPVTQMATTIFRFKQAKASYKLIDKILKLPVERPEDVNFLSLASFKGEIEFRGVSFSFPSQPLQQLQKVSFHIKPQEHVGIIGLNGSGKSTLLKMILKLYDPEEGTILIDGIDNHQIDPTELRHFIGYVPQEVTLFQGSIKDNLKLGIFGIDDEKLLNAVKASGLERLIKEHPEGLERQIGERGLGLSGGERQLIAFTRAILTNPSLLMLDEPTNSMDDLGIAHFIRSLSQMKNKTIILVTHKVELLKLVDRLLVIHKGKIVLDGPRDDVLSKLRKTKI